MNANFLSYLTTAGAILFAFLILMLIFARLYRRASKEVSFVRTGFGGQKVIMNGGALVFPVLHETIPVNMNTLRLEVVRHAEQALITRDRMRVDVQAEFYVRVQPSTESIANAAQTLGQRTMQPQDLKLLIEGKFVDALRAVAAEMAMEELHEQRVNFVQKVQAAVSEDILKNGLELESVSLTGLDQTGKQYFNPDNAFDAEGLTKLTEEIEARRLKRNSIEQDTEVSIQRKNLEAQQQQLQISRELEYARLEQQREIEIRKAEQGALIAQQQADRAREAEQAKISADQQIKESGIAATQRVAERDIEKARQVMLAEQDRDIAVAERSRAKSEADAKADEARAIAVRASESVLTARATETAEREKAIELIEARKQAEQVAIAIQVAAESEKLAAVDQAEAVRLAASAEANKLRITAEGAADAEKLKASAMRDVYDAEAEGKRKVNEAANTLSAEQIAMQIRQALIAALPSIIEQTVKPMERIEGIKILQIDGLHAQGSVGNDEAPQAGLADQAVNAALRYRTQVPILDALMAELGLTGAELGKLPAMAAPKPDEN